MIASPGTGSRLPAAVAGLCDDAAVFPPGLAPLADAVRAYAGRSAVWYEALVGPLVLPASDLPRLGPLLPADRPPLPVSVTVPGGPAGVAEALAAAAQLRIDLRSLEVAVPAGVPAATAMAQLDQGVAGAGGPAVYVEIPRDDRRGAVLDAVAGRYRAKYRTGGVRADLHPDEAELAASLAAAVRAGVAFKATAGLHHALRNTDPETGFEQHGFLNLLLATDALVHGGSEADARMLLAERDRVTVAAAVRGLDEQRAVAVRACFTSFGTCSITDPLDELVELGIVERPASPAAVPMEGASA